MIEKLIEKAATARNKAAAMCARLAVEKKSNLVLGLDVTDRVEFKRILRDTAEQIVALKTHVDVIEDFDWGWWMQVVDLCKEHDIVVFEDRKFADVGNTVKLQYSSGVYKIADWANIVTCHAVAGPGTIEGLKAVAASKLDAFPRGCIMLAQMTGTGTLATGDYTRQAVEMVLGQPDFCAGFIGNASNPQELKSLSSMAPTGTLIFAPGVKLTAGAGSLGQQYSTPKQATDAGADFIIVSSGIYESTDPQRAAMEYRKLGWTQDV